MELIIPWLITNERSTTGEGLVIELLDISRRFHESTAPKAVTNADLDTQYTSNLFLPDFATGSVITFTTGLLSVNGVSETSPHIHAAGDEYQMTITSSDSYSTAVAMTLLDDGVAGSVFTVTSRAEASDTLRELTMAEIRGMTMDEIRSTSL